MRRNSNCAIHCLSFALVLCAFVINAYPGDVQPPTAMTELPEIRTLWNFGDPSGSEQRFREAHSAALTIGDAIYALEVDTQIARALGLQGRFEEANSHLDGVEEKLDEAPNRVRIRYLLERGRVFNSSGQPTKGKPLFIDAWEVSRSADEDSLAVDAAHMVAIASETDEQVAWNLKAMELAEASADPLAKNWIGALTNNLGWTFHDRGDSEKALEMFDRSLAFYSEKGLDPQARIARWSRAKILRVLGRTEDALGIQESLLKEFEEIGEVDGYVFEELGECLLALDRAEEAKPYFHRAYEELSKDDWLVQNESDRLERIKRLSAMD
ncbi:MAG: tetratricopeptide repeat protein [Candidatus Omnitrophica bacterium]|nr:tetratricopeptide repeat protein [Candidatus Omnitrophota bacterium]